MAKYSLTQEQFVKYYAYLTSRNRLNIFKILIALIIVIFIVCILFFLKQYVSAVVLLLIALYFTFFINITAKFSTKRYYNDNNIFHDIYFLTFSNDKLVIKIKSNNLQLSIEDFNYVDKADDIYYISHVLGIKLFIPISSLNDSEIIYIKKYYDYFKEKKKQKNK